MFHRLTKMCAHFKYSRDSILTQIHPIMIFLTPRKSIPKSPEGFPDSFLAYWKINRGIFYGKDFRVLTMTTDLLFQIPETLLHTVSILQGHRDDSHSKPFCTPHLNFLDLKRICTPHSFPLQRKLIHLLIGRGFYFS